MKKWLALLGIIGLTISPLRPGSASQLPGKSGFFWRMELDSQIGYLLGTVELTSRKGLYPLRPEIEKAFAQSTTLLIENSESETSNTQSILDTYKTLPESEQKKAAGTFMKIMQRGLYIGEDNLQNHVAAETYARIAGIASRYKLDLDQIRMYRPWIAGFALISQVQRANAANREQRLQDYFLAKARGQKEWIQWQGTPIDLLRKLQSAMPDFFDFVESQGEGILKYGLSFAERQAERDEKLLRIWQAADARALDAWSQGEMAEFVFLGVLDKKTRANLGATLVPRIVSLLRSGKKCFIIWNVQKLLGAEGIIARLRQQGVRCYPL